MKTETPNVRRLIEAIRAQADAQLAEAQAEHAEVMTALERLTRFALPAPAPALEVIEDAPAEDAPPRRRGRPPKSRPPEWHGPGPDPAALAMPRIEAASRAVALRQTPEIPAPPPPPPVLSSAPAPETRPRARGMSPINPYVVGAAAPIAAPREPTPISELRHE